MGKFRTSTVTDLAASRGRPKRSTKLISDFRDGYTKGWAFCLPASFRDALDIKLTTRVLKGKKTLVWTQGKDFAFRRGDIIYDGRPAYKMSWSKGVKLVDFALQVTEDKFELEFNLLKVKRGKLVLLQTFRSTQEEFVRLLQYGLFCDVEGVEIGLDTLRIPAHPGSKKRTG